MGVLGAGLSTAVSQMVSFCLLLFMFLSGKTGSKFSFRWITKDPSDIILIWKTGLPSLMRQGLSSISTMVLNGQAGVYGDAAVAAFNYGTKKYDRVRKGFVFTWDAGEIILGVIAIAGMMFSTQLVGFFRDDS